MKDNVKRAIEIAKLNLNDPLSNDLPDSALETLILEAEQAEAMRYILDESIKNCDELCDQVNKLREKVAFYEAQEYPKSAAREKNLVQQVRLHSERINSQSSEIEKLREQVNSAYLERNRVVAALAKCFQSGLKKTAIEGWDAAWHNCVYIQLPTGQASWHFHDEQAELFKDVSPCDWEWDGHGTEEKYKRLEALPRRNAAITALECENIKLREVAGQMAGALRLLKGRGLEEYFDYTELNEINEALDLLEKKGGAE